MATTKNIYVASSGLRATVATPVINASYQNSGISTSTTQYGVQISQSPDIEINVQGAGIGGGHVPDRSTVIGDNIVYTILFTNPQINITGHTTNIGDSYHAFSIGKGFSETKTISEDFSKSLSSYKLDTAGIFEDFAKAYGKPLIDTFIRTDTTSLGINKNIISPVGSTDNTKVSVEKLFLESKQITERVVLVANFRREFLDFVAVTDDFYGTANLDDDQTARFTKVVVDYTTTLDTNTISSNLVKIEELTTSDTKYLQATKEFADAISKSDRFSAAFDKSVVDLSSGIDLFSVTVSKPLEETTSNTDELSTFATKVFVETNTAVDTSSLTATKPFTSGVSFFNRSIMSYVWNAHRTPMEQPRTSDTLSASPSIVRADLVGSLDIISLLLLRLYIFVDHTNYSDTVTTQVNYNRIFDDYVDTTDDFFGIANLDDDQSSYFNKAIPNHALFADLTSFDSSIFRSDQYNANDTKYLEAIKVFADSAYNSDIFSLDYNKYLSELNTFLDTNKFNVIKSVEDTSDTVEAFNVSLIRPFTESKIINDTSSLTTSKPFTSGVSFFNRSIMSYVWNAHRIPMEQSRTLDIASAALNTVKSDTAIARDTLTFSMGRLFILLDATSITDVANTQVSFNRLFNDYVYATDDFFGTANLDDDQTSYFNKTIPNHAIFSDYVSFSGSKGISEEPAAVLDTRAVELRRPLTDGVIKYDQLSLYTDKAAISISAATDTLSNRTAKVLIDTFSTPDTSSRKLITVHIDPVATTDIRQSGFSKTILDTSDANDIISFIASLKLTDATNQTQDTATLTAVKKLLDNSTNTDITYTETYKVLLDQSNLKNADTVASSILKTMSGSYPQVSDRSSRSLDTKKSDSINISETKIQLVTNYFRNYSDTLDVTDDFYGEANVDDDQTARIDKRVVDYSNPVDLKSVYATVVKSDTAVGTDTPYKQNKKSVLDTVISSDVFSFNKVTDRDLADVRNVSDSVYISWQDYCEPDIFELTYVGEERFLSYN